jgi:hypothetical protein
MPFEPAIEFLIKHERETAERLYSLKRPKWLLTEAGSIPALIALFGTAPENAEWDARVNGSEYKGDVNKVMGVRQRIAWLAGCRADFRRQFASMIADTPRTQMERTRYVYLNHERSRRVLERLKELQLQQRNKPITQRGT